MPLQGFNLFLQYALALMIPLVATLWLTPLAGRLAHRLGILDHPRDHRFHNEVTPYLGGLAVAGGLVFVGIFAASASKQLLTILLGGFAIMLVGFEDDRREIGPIVKIIVEVGAATALWLAGVRVSLFGIPALDLAITVLWVVAITNSMNLLDNMDGLASGASAIAAIAFFIIAAGRGDYLVGSFALAIAGASLGFLRHNFPPARIFLGDAGSLLLGFLLAALALKLDLFGESGFVRGAVPILILGVPIFDTILVVTARLLERRPVYVGGTDHSSHRLSDIGLSGHGVAFVTYAAQIVCCAIALLLLHTPPAATLAIVVAVGAVALIILLRLLSHPASLAHDDAAAADSPGRLGSVSPADIDPDAREIAGPR
jgi:UDP-GlcNAc:undecaprenyl-phosphate GlcNAc-1-phosphate transferase